MSYDLTVWHTTRRLNDKESLDLYQRLCDGDVADVDPNPAVDAFYQELTALHPEIDDVPGDRIDDEEYCPWSVAHDRSPGHIIMCCAWSRAEYCDALIRRLAKQHGLAVFDPQESRVEYP